MMSGRKLPLDNAYQGIGKNNKGNSSKGNGHSNWMGLSIKYWIGIVFFVVVVAATLGGLAGGGIFDSSSDSTGNDLIVIPPSSTASPAPGSTAPPIASSTSSPVVSPTSSPVVYDINLIHFAPLRTSYVDLISGNMVVSGTSSCHGFGAVGSLTAWQSTCEPSSYLTTQGAVTPTGDQTQCIWTRLTTYSPQNNPIFTCDSLTNTATCLQLWYSASNGYVWRLGAGTDAITSSQTTLPLSTWVHLCATLQYSTDIVAVYTNGTVLKSGQINNAGWKTLIKGQPMLGGWVNPVNPVTGGFRGNFLYYRMYSKALNDQEISNLYTNEASFTQFTA